MDCNWRAYGELARRREGKDLLSVEIDADLVGLTEKIDALHFAFGWPGAAPSSMGISLTLCRLNATSTDVPVDKNQDDLRGILRDFDTLDFNFIRDIVPVASIDRAPFVMVVSPSVPAKTVPEFIA
jgi:hypothetical protein